VQHALGAYVFVGALAASSAGAPLDTSEWRYFTPVLSTETRPLQVGNANELLANFCQTPVTPMRGIGLTCKTHQLGRGFFDIIERMFHPRNFLPGHFLGPESHDVAIGGSSAEGHPGRFGGTLLLTKRETGWSPVGIEARS
jgi:hypothetical protein